MTTPHKHAETLRAIADGIAVQFRNVASKDCEDWCTWSDGCDSPLSPHGDSFEWRIKPATLTINGVECPAPTRGRNFVIVRLVFDEAHTDDAEYVAWYNAEADALQVFNALTKPFMEQP